MNTFAPQHSRLFKEMVLVAKPSKPFEYTAKNTPRRQGMIDKYSDEIEALYEVVEATTQTSIPLPKIWDIISATNFVGAVVRSVLVHEVKDNGDIFQHGCDRCVCSTIARMNFATFIFFESSSNLDQEHAHARAAG